MRTETSMFFQYVLSENRPISEFIDAKYTFLNEDLAKFYGIDGVKGPDFRRVELTTDQRGGVLTQGSVLAVSSYPNRTSPTIRGKYILNNILGTPPPPPPPDVPHARRFQGRQRCLAPQAAGSASRQRRLRLVPQQDGRARLRPGELRRHRQMAHHGRQVPHRCRRYDARTASRFRPRRKCAPCCWTACPRFPAA